MFAQELSFHKLTADVSSDKLWKVWWGGPLDLVFINWRLCRHCLQNEWPLGLSVAVLKVPAHLLGTPSWKHHWFGLFCKKKNTGNPEWQVPSRFVDAQSWHIFICFSAQVPGPEVIGKKLVLHTNSNTNLEKI